MEEIYGRTLMGLFCGKRYEHLWGYELWLTNTPKYCCKLLCVNSGFVSSWHAHERKDETFFVLSGEIELVVGNLPDPIVLSAGNNFRIFPGTFHSFQSISDQSVIMEVSTTDDNDNIKRIPAQAI